MGPVVPVTRPRADVHSPLPAEGTRCPFSSPSELRAHSYHNYPAQGQERGKPTSCKCIPRGDLNVLIVSSPSCDFALSVCVYRRAPPGKCKYQPVPVKTKSKKIRFRPLARESLPEVWLSHGYSHTLSKHVVVPWAENQTFLVFFL